MAQNTREYFITGSKQLVSSSVIQKFTCSNTSFNPGRQAKRKSLNSFFFLNYCYYLKFILDFL